MNELNKTIAFAAAGILLVGLAFATHPRPLETAAESDVGSHLFPKMKDLDPLAVKGLEIVSFDESTATPDKFDVKQVKGRWVLPAHQNYPVDATQHMKEAALAVMDLRIEDLVSDKVGDRELYGVVEPDPGSLTITSKGVGLKIAVKDGQDKPIAEFIVGKEKKDHPDLRYVRRVGDDKIYLMQVQPGKWSTKFGDWIEKDLLQFNPSELKQLVLRDYNIQLDAAVVNGVVRPVVSVADRGIARLDFASDKWEWKLASYEQRDDMGNAVDVPIKDNEELNTTRLNDLRTALQDLKIVDVERKPTGLEGTLEEFLKTKDAAQSLFEHGFFATGEDGKVRILSNEGEVICRMKNGVEYVLRFGDIAGTSMDSPDKDKPADKGKSADKSADKGSAKSSSADDKSKSSVNRYIWVMAQFNDKNLSMTKPDPLPPDEKPAEGEKSGDQPAAGKSGDAKTDDTKSEAPKSSTTADDKKSADDAKDDKKDEKKDDKKEDPAVARKKLEMEYNAKLAMYEAQVKQGQDRVKELNKRFGEWYYVVSDSEYKKIHLGRSDLIRLKEKAAAPGTGADEATDLFNKGLGGLPGKDGDKNSKSPDSKMPDSKGPDSKDAKGGDSKDK